MASDGKIKVVAELDSRKFDTGLDSMESRAKRAADAVEATIVKKSSKAGRSGADELANAGESGASRIEKRFDALGSAVQGVFSGIAQSVTNKAIDSIVDSIGGAIQRVDTMRNFPKVMQNFGVSSQDASKMVQQLDKGVRGLPTSLSDITATVQSFVPLTKDTKTATRTTLALNDALVAGGQSATIQKNALEQYRQALAKGKPSLQDWRSIQSAMPAQLQQIAKYLGVGSGALSGYTANSQGLYEALKDGSLSMDDLNNAIVALDTKGGDGVKDFHDQAKDASGGIQTSMTNAKLAVQRGVADIITALRGGRDGKTFVEELGLAFEKLAKTVADVIKFIEKHPLGTKIAVGVFGAVESIGWLSKTIGTLKGDGVGISAVFSGIGRALGKTNIGSFAKLVGDCAGKLGGLAGAASSAGGALGGVLGSIGSFLAANPIVLVVGAIALVIGALVLLYNKCEPFRNFVDGIVSAIVGFVQNAAKVIGDVVSKTIEVAKGVIGGIAGFIGSVIDGISSVIGKVAEVVSNVIGAIVGAIQSVWDAIAPLRDFLYNVFIFTVAVITNIIDLLVKGLVGGLMLLWNNVLSPLWNFLWGTILEPLIDSIIKALITYIQVIINVVQWIWDKVVEVWNGIVGVLAQVSNWVDANIIVPVVSFFVGLWNTITTGVQAAWDTVTQTVGAIAGWINDNVIQPVVGFVSGLWNGIISGVQNVWNSAKNIVSGVANWIKTNVIDRIVGFFQTGWNAVKSGVQALKDGIANVFSTIAGIIKAPINGIIDGINGVIKAMNSLKIPDWVPGLGGKHANFGLIKKLATGGLVQGVGTGTSDSNLAWLSRGEYVVKADTVRRYGVEFMDALNSGRLVGGGGMTQNYYYQFDRNANSRWQYQQIRTGAAA